jgi:hypothetical protein
LSKTIRGGDGKAAGAMLRLYRLVATMNATAPLPSLADQEPT